MKTLITFFVACLFTIHASTQSTYSVSNHALGGAQYDNLFTAHAAAAVDDILLVEGTLTPYDSPGPTFAWDKRQTVIGQGFNTQKQGFETTKFQYAGYSGSFTIGPNASGSRFYGIDFMPAYVQLTDVNDLVFEDCLFRSDVRVWLSTNNDNIVFKNCIFQGNIVVNNGASMSWLITNCVLNGQIIGANTPQSIIVDHCLFLSSAGYFTNLDQAEIKNSMFINSNTVGGITNSNFQNNHAVVDTDGDGQFDGDGDTEGFFRFPETGNNIDVGGNLTDIDPIMTNYSMGSLYSPAHDYHLQTGSPSIGLAADGTDIGVHGGFTHFSEHGEPLVTPVIRSMNVINTSVAPGGTLSVQVVASKPYDN